MNGLGESVIPSQGAACEQFSAEEKVLGIYVHWPFCVQKCAYCSFVSSPDRSREGDYVEAVLQEIECMSVDVRECVDSIFFGGGTPSLCPVDSLARILGKLRDSFRVTDTAEITMEANPGTLFPGQPDRLRSLGVNRLSIGLQAVRPEHLKLLGRIHTLETFEHSFFAAREAGFGNVNVDLIYGFPTQTLADWRQTLAYVARLGPEHVSLYALSLEEGTPLLQLVERGSVPAIDEDLAADMYVEAREFLRSEGFHHYEISNFARPGYECRHNLKYWTHAPYLGIGAAAHSLMGNARFANPSSVEEYVSNLKHGTLRRQMEEIDAKEREREYLMLRTRLDDGFSLRQRESLFGPKELPGLRRALDLGLVEMRGERIVPTEKGFLFQNRLALLLMSDV